MRQAKLVCTIGPASRNRIAELVEAGMDVARLNFSHGSVAEHLDALAEVRAASEASGRQLAVMGDLPGPKVRLGQLAGGEVELSAGQTVRLASGPDGEADGDGAGLALPVSYPRLGADVAVGDPLLLADGAAEMRVIAARPEQVTAEVVRGGSIRSGAGLNVPSERLGLPAVTDRDRAALAQMLEAGVDFVAQSFVRRAEDLHELRRLMGDRAVPIVAKIETRAALANLGELLSEADAVMLARGDLGVELPYAEVPVVQKRLIADCVRAGVPVIVATQMLESMVHASRPTRAEASDVANAVLDGADAVMLSAETAIGEHPLEAARAAAQIVVTAEQAGLDGAPVVDVGPAETEAGTIAAAAVDASRRAADPPISGIACFTRRGLTARLLAARRPPCPIHALSPDPAILRRLALWRGVIPVPAESPNDTDAMIRLADVALRGAGIPDGAWVVIVGSIPFGAARTNFLKLHRLGSAS